MIKLNRLETHDRMLHFKKQNFSIEECCQDLIDKRPFGNHPFYIFSHARTDEDGVTKRLIWQPRLTRPKPQTNSMLFKAYPGTDVIRICWIIPAKEMWAQYKKGQVCENLMIDEFIDTFESSRKLLEKPEDDDYSDDKIDQIYRELAQEARNKKMMDRLYSSKPKLVL